jgi:fibronectin-binding autotransporter adhesin
MIVKSGRKAATTAKTGIARLAASASFIALAIAGWPPSPASAGSYTASNATELSNAITAANASTDPSSTITLLNSFTLPSNTTLPMPTKSITIDTQGFVLSGATGVGGTAITFFSAPFPSVVMTINGAFVGGNQVGIGNPGAGLSIQSSAGSSGQVVNNGSLTGGNATVAGKPGGAGASMLLDSTLVNNGTITGGIANAYVRPSGSIQGSGVSLGSGSALTNNVGATVLGGNSQGSGAGAGLYLNATTGAVTATNYGTIRGGSDLTATVAGNAAVRGLSNTSAVSTLTNFGLLEGGNNAAAISQDGTWNLAIVNGGTISAGAGQSNAILFGQSATSTSSLELRAGSVIQGNVVANTVGASETLRLGGAADATFDVSLIGPAAQYQNFDIFQKTGASTWSLTGTGTATTNWDIQQGTLQIGAGGTTGSIIGNVTNAGTLAFNRSNTVTYSGTISGNGSVVQMGSGATNLTGTNSYTGGTTITAGTLQIGAGGTTGSILGDVVDNGALVFSRSDAWTFAGAITGTGSVSSISGGTTTLTGNSTYGGSTNVSGGGEIRILGATVNSGGSSLISGATLTVDAGGVFNFATGAAQSASGVAGVINVRNGGILRTTGNLTLRNSPTGIVLSTLNVSGGGSLVDIGGSLLIAAQGTTNVNGVSITGGGKLTTVAASTMGAGAGNSTAPFVTIDGAGTAWTSANGLTITNGNLSLTNGGTASFNTVTAGTVSAARQGAVTVLGAGSQLTTTGDLVIGGGAGTGALTLSDGGRASAGGSLLLGNGGTATGILNIGGAEGQAAVGIGTFDATALVFGGTGSRINFNHTAPAYSFATGLSGTGSVNQVAGTTILTADNSYSGATTISGGTLRINGDQSVATGLTSVLNGGRLGGSGTIGGNVTVANGGTLAPGNSPGTLTIAGDLNLASGSLLDYEFGQSSVVGGPLNDLTVVGGNLTLDGTIDVTVTSGGNFDTGVYRILSYGGTLTDNGLTLGTLPAGSVVGVQTSIAGQVNLVNSAGATVNFWDDAGPKLNGFVNGGNGVWQNSGGNDNWTDITGTFNNAYNDGAFAIFMATPGTVTVDNSLGAVTASGMQFASSGYIITGSDIGLIGPQSVIRVGDGTTVGAGFTATIASSLTGASQLVKTDLGTLVLAGTGSYAGGTTVAQGTLIVNGDFGAATGLVTINGGATLGGAGIIGGDVSLGGTLAPGAGGTGTLTINGDLAIGQGATLAYAFGQANIAGGTLNDLVKVGGDLILDGTIDVTVPTGGAFDAGIYRVFDYGGALTNNGLTLGALPAGGNVTVQTSIAGQVNLVNSAGLTLNFWDGAAGPKNNGVINGGTGVWQNGAASDNWTDASGAQNAAYSDGAFAVFGGAGGTATVDNGAGPVTASGMQFAAGGYTVTGGEVALTGPQATIRVGDGSAAGASYGATINSALSGNTQLVKTDAGTLVLGGANTYTGGTLINGGTVQIASDTNLGAATGDVTLNGGTLATAANLTSGRSFTVAGPGTFLTASSTTLTLTGALSGNGALTKAGVGTLVVTGNGGGYAGAVTVASGTFDVRGTIGGGAAVAAGARLEGIGQLGSVVNNGTVAPGGEALGTLTLTGSYASGGGTLEIATTLGGDASATDRLVVGGGTSGTTEIILTNRGGLGAQTVEGIKIVDVAGASDGVFTLRGDYQFEGAPAVVAGAYGYRLYKNGISTVADGDWYLRSALLSGGGPQIPLYQPGVPVYEAYGQTMLALSEVGTMQERIGNRQWVPASHGKSFGIWGRMESKRTRPNATLSTSLADVDVDNWKLELGADHVLSERSDGATLVLGVLGGYGEASASIGSPFGGGSIKIKGYSAGATLSWFGPQGFYVDSRAQATWFDSKLKSAVLGTLADGNNGMGQAYSVEMGKRTPIGGMLSVTPQIQMVYSTVGFDRFTDPNDAVVSSKLGDSLKTRWGISLDRQDARSHLYAVGSFFYEWLDGTVTDVSGTPITRANDRLWGELGLGGSVTLDERLVLYGEASADTALNDFGKSYALKGVAGLRLTF